MERARYGHEGYDGTALVTTGQNCRQGFFHTIQEAQVGVGAHFKSGPTLVPYYTLYTNVGHYL